MPGTDRFTYMSPTNSVDPDANNLQRYQTQPFYGAFYYGRVAAGATAVAATTWSQITLDPLATVADATKLIDIPNSIVQFKESGIYHVDWRIVITGGVATTGTYATCFLPIASGSPNGYNQNYEENFLTTPPGVHLSHGGAVIVSEADIRGITTCQYRVMAFCQSARNVEVDKLEITLVSKTLPGKY
jgi:hypothetical protein